MPVSFPRMHVSLYVSNIQNSLAFYTLFFGQEASKTRPGYAKFELASPSLIISFVENTEKVAPDFGHLGFQVADSDDLEARLKVARQQQLPVLEEMNVSCCYAEQDKFWVTDPDGYHWEVYLFKSDAEFNDPRYSPDASGKECCTPNAISEPVLVKTQTAACCASGQC